MLQYFTFKEIYGDVEWAYNFITDFKNNKFKMLISNEETNAYIIDDNYELQVIEDSNYDETIYRFKNKNGRCESMNGHPAEITVTKNSIFKKFTYMKDGRFYREDGPAVISFSNSAMYVVDDVRFPMDTNLMKLIDRIEKNRFNENNFVIDENVEIEFLKLLIIICKARNINYDKFEEMLVIKNLKGEN